MDKFGGRVVYVEIEPSLKEFRLNLKEAGKEIKREIRRRLKEVGEEVASEARILAREKGLVDTGRLIRSIKPTASQTSVKIRATAKKRSRKYPAGYNYPKRHEFEKKGARAFLRPALKNKEEEVLAKFRGVIEEVSQKIKRR